MATDTKETMVQRTNNYDGTDDDDDDDDNYDDYYSRERRGGLAAAPPSRGALSLRQHSQQW